MRVSDLPRNIWQSAVCLASPLIVRGGESIFEREWDICCVLDGCRVDTFNEVYDGPHEWMRSVASTSQTWLPRTFGDADTEGVGYISGNPFASQLDAERFGYFHLEGVRAVGNVETVPPKSLTDRAIDVWRRRGELGVDRLVIHYMQPHVPFRSRPEWFDKFNDTETWGSVVWQEVAAGRIDREEWFEAYRDNLQWALADIDRLTHNCDGRIALTADHGNAAGEFGIAGHPEGAPTAEVRTVPWATVDGADTGTVEPDIDETTDFDVQAQLEALGYRARGDV